MSDLPLLKEFIYYLKENNYSEESIYNYKRDLAILKNFLDDEGVKFQEIKKTTLSNYKHYLVSSKRKTANRRKVNQALSASSANRALSVLKSYLNFLIDRDYSPPVSPQIIKLIKIKRKKLQDIKLEDQIRLIEAPTKFEKNKAVASRNRAALETIFSTGMRISELVNLKQSAIDKQGRILIRGKGKKERFVYLTERAKHHLKNYLEIRGNTDSLYVFVPFKGSNAAKKNKKISPNYLQERIKKYRQLLGLNIPVSAHGIRHAFATYLAESGASPAAIQILLGHESLDTTTRYVNISDRYAEKAFKKFHPLKE